jgi:hypothetical protein
MTLLLAVALVLNFAIEAMAATTLIGGAQGLAAPPGADRWAMHYGFAVIAIASAGAWLWPFRRELAALTPVLGVLAVFHVAVLTSLQIAGDQREGAVLHGALALLFVALFTQRRKLAVR